MGIYRRPLAIRGLNEINLLILLMSALRARYWRRALLTDVCGFEFSITFGPGHRFVDKGRSHRVASE